MADLYVTIEDMLPPSTNHMYISTRRGKALSAKAIEWRTTAIIAIKNAAQLAEWKLPDGPLCFEMELGRRDKRRYDADNRIKAALDAVAIALDFDDERVCRIVCVKRTNSTETYTTLQIGAL